MTRQLLHEAITRLAEPTDLSSAALLSLKVYTQSHLELPLKAELCLTGIQRLDEATVGRKPDVRADAEGVGVVGEVVEADAEEENAVVLPSYEALGDAQVEAEDPAFEEGIAVEAGGGGGQGVSGIQPGPRP